MNDPCPGSGYQMFKTAPSRAGVRYPCPRCLRLHAINRDGTIRAHQKVTQ